MSKRLEMEIAGLSAECVKQHYEQADLIVEYGSGGSTCYAATVGATIVAVESSVQWMTDVIAACEELPGRVIPLCVDIGPTKGLGYPADESRKVQWRKYPVSPWEYCKPRGLSPDVVLIDGRFRVACFIATCTAIRQKTRILFDDFARTCYHSVLDVVDPVDIVDGRLALFDVEPGQLLSTDTLRLSDYSLDPR